MPPITEIFASKAQVKVLAYMLQYKNKVVNQAFLASSLHLSPSTVARVIEPLIKQKILKYERFGGGMKILCLNLEDQKTRVLIEFHEKMSQLP